MDLKIIEPIHSPLKIFDSKENFINFYQTHKSELDSSTTHILNKKYKIEGYKITKIKGELSLKKSSYGANINSKYESMENELNTLKNDFNGLVNTVNTLINNFNEIISNNQLK